MEQPTRAQEDVLRYLGTQEHGGQYSFIGKDTVKAIDRNGREMSYTCNLYGDIMDASTKEVIAISDLPHSLEELQITARPQAWTKKGGSEQRKQ